MSQTPLDNLETRLLQAAHNLSFPPTPDLAAYDRLVKPSREARLRPAHRLALVIGIAILLLAGLMSVPAVRAAVLEFLQLGAVRIFLVPPTQPMPPAATGTAAAPSSTPIYLASISELGGETTLAQARRRAGFPIPLPTYPANLGEPDKVFLQDLDGKMVVLVWSDPNQNATARMSLDVIGPGSFTLIKDQPELVKMTSVNGKDAIWAVGPYPLELKNGRMDIRRMVDGNVLIWTDGPITYRLETSLPMDEAVKIAESLR